MSTGPYQHNGSVEACTAFLASQHRPKPTDSEQLRVVFANHAPEDEEWSAHIKMLNEWQNPERLLRDLIQYARSGPFYPADMHVNLIEQYLVQRDQQRLSAVDRFEVIDETRRAYVKGSIYGSPVKVELSYQNDGKTLKAFVTAALDPDNSSVEEKDARD